MPKPINFDIYLITDRNQVAPGHTLCSAVEAALCGGIRAVQLREKDLDTEALRPLARQLRELTSQYEAALFINDRIDLALEIEADGVHLGGHSQPTDLVRKRVGPEMLIGVSTHSSREVAQATRLGADFVTFGPVYETPSKIAFGPPQGLETLTGVCRESAVPVFALGGITRTRAAEVMATGVRGIAMISAVLSAKDPRAAAQEFVACRSGDLG